jgi:hypothetical protein
MADRLVIVPEVERDIDVTVYAVFHSARDPDKWRQRLG